MWKLPAGAWKRLRLLSVLMGLAAFLFLMPSRFTAPARVLFNEAVGPVQTALFQGAGKTLAASGTLTEMFRKRDRERALTREVARLRNENAALTDHILRLGRSLQSAEKLQVKRFPFRAVRAPVAAYDASAMHSSITVRAGARDGVGAGMAVTADGALVGIVVEVGPRQSRVRLITDPDSAVPCRVGPTRRLCILQGTGGRTCRVDWIGRDSFVEPADVLATAVPQAGPPSRMRIPEGVPAATVARVEPDAMSPLFLAVEAAPRVNLNRLEAVEVLIPQQAEPRPD